MKKDEIKNYLGQTVKDTITGAVGVCISYSMSVYRSPRIEITPIESKDGHPCDSYWDDPVRYDILDEIPRKTIVTIIGDNSVRITKDVDK